MATALLEQITTAPFQALALDDSSNTHVCAVVVTADIDV